MNITNIKIRHICQENRLRAVVSIVLDDELAVHDIKVIEGPDHYFIAMPSKKEDDGTFRDITHPISSVFREKIEKEILEAYYQHLAYLELFESSSDVPNAARGICEQTINWSE